MELGAASFLTYGSFCPRSHQQFLVQLGTGSTMLARHRAAFVSAACLCLLQFCTADGDASRSLQWLFGGGSSASIQPYFGLTRAPEAVKLEAFVDNSTTIGHCYRNVSLMPDVPAHVCHQLLCLWSEPAQKYIDVSNRIFQEWKSTADPPYSECAKPVGGHLPIPEDKKPTISFIIPYLNNPEPTSRCLLELFRTAREVPGAEFVLVSDNSDNETLVLQTVERLQTLFGMRVIHHHATKQGGFGGSVNKGGELSSGEYVAIINNDAYVIKGWLYAIFATFNMRHSQRKAGLVGPMFVGRKNLVQEGGGWMFTDATGGNYGKNKPLSNEVNYLREVDYVSAAATVIPRRNIANFGILDEAYENGYYEDTDLAFRIAAKGERVLFQPLSVVYHQEGTTFGTDESDWKQKLMAKNRKVFVDRWSKVLKEQHCPPETEWPTAVRRKAWPRILWVDDKILEPDRDSGSIRTFNILKVLLEEGFDVTYQACNVMLNRSEYYEPMHRFFGLDTPRVLPPTMWNLIDGNGNCKYDAIVVARRYVYQPAIDYIKQDCPCAPLIYDAVDLHFLREARGEITKISKANAWNFNSLSADKICEWVDKDESEAARELRASRDIEVALMDASDVIVVVSHVEAEVVKHFRPEAKVTVISNTHDLPAELPPVPDNCEERTGVMFIGSFGHPPNRQAIVTFIEELLPLVVEYLPAKHMSKFMFNIIGSDDVPKDLVSLLKDNEQYVKYHGYLPEEDVKRLFNTVKVFAAPLLSGAGVKGKVNQAMKYSLPVVGTPIAFEAMFPSDGEDCMVATSPEDFAKKIVEVYTDCKLWARLVDGGQKNIRKNFGMEVARNGVLETLALIDIKPRDGPPKCEVSEDLRRRR